MLANKFDLIWFGTWVYPSASVSFIQIRYTLALHMTSFIIIIFIINNNDNNNYNNNNNNNTKSHNTKSQAPILSKVLNGCFSELYSSCWRKRRHSPFGLWTGARIRMSSLCRPVWLSSSASEATALWRYRSFIIIIIIIIIIVIRLPISCTSYAVRCQVALYTFPACVVSPWWQLHQECSLVCGWCHRDVCYFQALGCDLGPLDGSPYDVVYVIVTLLPWDALATRQSIQRRACTALPHTQVCGSQALQPSLWATAILMASSESHRPTEVIGGAFGFIHITRSSGADQG